MVKKFQERAKHITGGDRSKYRKDRGRINIVKRMIYAIEADVEMHKAEDSHNSRVNTEGSQ